MNKVFILRRDDGYWEESIIVVVVAPDEETARKEIFQRIMKRNKKDETLAREYLNPKFSTCEEVDLTKTHVLLEI